MSESAPRLILVKHAMPEVVEGKPASSWLLSEEGKQACRPLAERLQGYGPDVIVTSTEPKANETGLRVSSVLGLPFESAPDLHETLRESVPFSDSVEAFHARLQEFFSHPDDLVFGEETANQARERFTAAVEAVQQRHAGRTVAIVCHGTVISLFVSRLTGQEPFELWRQLGLPSIIVVPPDDPDAIEVIPRIS